jgi:hypothetical protein
LAEGDKITERKKQKCALTSTGLLMEGLEDYVRVARHLEAHELWKAC